MAFFAAVVTTALLPQVAHPVLGATLLALVAWLVVHDVARRTVRSTGLPRYLAWCLLAGYAWLVVAGATWLLRGPVTQGPAYDSVVHALFLGFTLSMIIAHAPVILPAVLARPLPYHPTFFVPVVLLHASLVLRIAVGDAPGEIWALRAGGAPNITAVFGFVGLAIWLSIGAGAGARVGNPARTGGLRRKAVA